MRQRLGKNIFIPLPRKPWASTRGGSGVSSAERLDGYHGRKPVVTGFIVFALAWLVLPLARADAEDLSSKTKAALDPDSWFNAVKKNITVPLPSASSSTRIPSPKESLKNASPKLKEINEGVKEETGIDFAKFIAWFAKVLGVVFQIIVSLLQSVAGALK